MSAAHIRQRADHYRKLFLTEPAALAAMDQMGEHIRTYVAHAGGDLEDEQFVYGMLVALCMCADTFKMDAQHGVDSIPTDRAANKCDLLVATCADL